MAHENFKSCIDACNDCAVACDNCAAACLKDPDVAKMATSKAGRPSASAH